MSKEPTLSLDEFIAEHEQLSAMPFAAAVQTVERWVISGRIEWRIDPLSGHTTIERRFMKSEEERQKLNVRRAAGRIP